MRTLLTVFLITICLNSQAQKELNSNLSSLFGGLPIDKKIENIIELVEKDKNYSGNSHFNLAMSYSGIIKNNSFFKFKPDTCFIEIIEDAFEVTSDSTLFGESMIDLDVCYKATDSIEVKKEFNRIVNSLSQFFMNKNSEIRKNSELSFEFYLDKKDKTSLINMYIEKEYCYIGHNCMKIYYWKKKH